MLILNILQHVHYVIVYTYCIVYGTLSVGILYVSKKLNYSFTIFTDIAEKFSVAMALLNLALRPISVVMLSRISADRMGSDDGFPRTFGNLFGGMYLAFWTEYYELIQLFLLKYATCFKAKTIANHVLKNTYLYSFSHEHILNSQRLFG